MIDENERYRIVQGKEQDMINTLPREFSEREEFLGFKELQPLIAAFVYGNPVFSGDDLFRYMGWIVQAKVDADILDMVEKGLLLVDMQEQEPRFSLSEKGERLAKQLYDERNPYDKQEEAE